MNCSIIKDLLPLYIDGVCSEYTVKAIEEHIQHCEECKQTLKRLQQQTEYVQMIPEEVKKAITPFKKINTKRRIQVITAIVMTFLMTFFITTVGYLVYQDVGVVHDFFSPKVTAVVD
ncbi:anti-sigma factor family protein, partial [Viridibacillus sp. NPDC093762]|uniref:anti-sigma factor family protein n=1 Tax=Viridibacillus sp. NPDC093762 TaxID=3390720 RepID=UPI003CFEC8EB